MFLELLQPLMMDTNVKNLVLIINFCYAGIRLKNKLKNKFEQLVRSTPLNITLITLRLVVSKALVLATFLEQNSSNISDWLELKKTSLE